MSLSRRGSKPSMIKIIIKIIIITIIIVIVLVIIIIMIISCNNILELYT